MGRLRAALRGALPGATGRQPNIIHTSLLRVVDAAQEQLPAEAVAAVDAACAAWTAQLAGATLAPAAAWFVNEAVFSTVEGDVREELRFGGGGDS